MRITCDRSQLSPVLQAAARVVSKRPSTIVLAGVLLRAHDDRLTISATDLETAIELSVPADGAEPGAVVVDAQALARAVRALSAERVTIARDGSRVVVQDGVTSYRMPYLDSADYPQLPTVEGAEVTVSQDWLRGALRRTLYVPEESERMPVLGCVELRAMDGSLRLSATDGHRGSLVTIPAECDRGLERTAVVHAKALVEVARVLADEGDIHITLGEGLARFALPGCVITARVVEFEALPLDERIRALPADPPWQIRVVRQRLLDAVQRVSALGRDDAVVVLRTGDESLALWSHDRDFGEARETILAEVRGSGWVAVRARFLIEYLRSTDADCIVMAGVDQDSPLDWRAEGEAWYRHVIMPVRVEAVPEVSVVG